MFWLEGLISIYFQDAFLKQYYLKLLGHQNIYSKASRQNSSDSNNWDGQILLKSKLKLMEPY